MNFFSRSVIATGAFLALLAAEAANVTNVLENGEVVIQFKDAGSFSWTAPMDIAGAQLLVVGGGGGGGCGNAGGGGGGGQVIHKTGLSLVGGQTYAVSVGAGGASGHNNGAGYRQEGGNGGDSAFGDLTARGGGGGGGNGQSTAGTSIRTGLAGGNSGGACCVNGAFQSPAPTTGRATAATATAARSPRRWPTTVAAVAAASIRRASSVRWKAGVISVMMARPISIPLSSATAAARTRAAARADSST